MRFLPREEEFFDLFVQVADRSAQAATLLRELLTGPPGRTRYCVEAIKRLENEADEITHEVVRRLDRTFITPLDREDIHLLASDLDDVIDRIDGTARRAEIFRLGKAPEGIDALCEVIEKATRELQAAVKLLRTGEKVLPHCIETKRLEEEGDALYHTMLGRLFDTETDPIYIMKWKEIYDNLENAIDEAHDVANDLESIVIKNA
jgi:hypothetical protein